MINALSAQLNNKLEGRTTFSLKRFLSPCSERTDRKKKKKTGHQFYFFGKYPKYVELLGEELQKYLHQTKNLKTKFISAERRLQF